MKSIEAHRFYLKCLNDYKMKMYCNNTIKHASDVSWIEIDQQFIEVIEKYNIKELFSKDYSYHYDKKTDGVDG